MTDQARRVPGEAVTAITGLRLHPPGAEASVVNISATGVLSETAAKYRVGSPVQVQFEGNFAKRTVDGRVVRCEVATMGRDGVLRYHVAIEFDAPIPLEEPGAANAAPPPPAGVRNRW